jgi:hypothetical protein
MVTLMAVEEPTPLLQQYQQILESPFLQALGVYVEVEPAAEVEGVTVRSYRCLFDFARMDEIFGKGQRAGKGQEHPTLEEEQELIRSFFGSSGITLRMAAVDDKVVFVCHPDLQHMTRVITALRHGKGSLPASLQAVAKGVRQPLCLYFQGDLRHLMASIAGLALQDSSDAETRQAIEVLKAGSPVWIGKYATGDDRSYRGRFSLGVVALAQLLEDFEALPEADQSELDR